VNKTIAISVVLVIGIGSVVAWSQFRGSRLTPGQLNDMRETRAKLEEPIVTANAATDAVADTVAVDVATKGPGGAGTAPDVFRVRFDCSNGVFVAEFYKEWAEHGGQRVWDLVHTKFFDEARFYRVVPGFCAQWGLPADPAANADWEGQHVQGDTVVGKNEIGTITFAMGGGMKPSTITNATRSTQLFINYKDNSDYLDHYGFAPIGKVVEGLEVALGMHGGYGDAPSPNNPQGRGPNQGMIQVRGNEYLKTEFPMLDYIKSATIVPVEETSEEAATEPAEATPAPSE
jgi:peptidyl-prolyl cis-trans isomerase A (cyclophilin A)